MIIDCPPQLGILTTNALVYADEILIPMTADYLSLAGLSSLISTIENAVELGLNKDLKINGILITNFDKRKNLNNQILSTLQKQFGKLIYTSQIRPNISLAESLPNGMTIFEYAPKSSGAKCYLEFTKEFLKRTKK